jgi:hypothetical protein
MCRIAILATLAAGLAGLGCQASVAQLTDAGGNSASTGGAMGGATAGGTTGVGTTGGNNAGGGTTAQASGGATTFGGSAGSGTGGISGTSGNIGTGTSGGVGTSGGMGTGGVTGTGGTSGGLLGQACVIDQGVDPCAAVGLACLPSTDPNVIGQVCQLPAEFNACLTTVGCDDSSLQCLPFALGYYCLRACTGSSDCTILYTTCQGTAPAAVCYFDFCTLDSDGGVFGTCDAAGVGDGTCIPVAGGGGVCLQGGSVASGDVCSDQRGPGITAANLCQTDAACIPGGVSGAGHCAPLCGLDAGPSCPTPTFCQPSGSGDWGYCL